MSFIVMENLFRVTLVILGIIICLNVRAQHDPKKFHLIEARWDSTIKAPVIPDNVFVSGADGLIWTERQSKIEQQPKYYLSIFWSAPSIDGSFILTVTKKQVTLTSGHENPNPNYLFWFTDINPGVYEQIVKNIDQVKSSFEEYYLPFFFGRQLTYKHFIKEQPKLDGGDRFKKMYLNASKLIKLLNKDMPVGDKIVFPDSAKLKLIKPVMVASNPREITDFIIKY